MLTLYDMDRDQNSLARYENSLAKLASDTTRIAPLMNIKTGHEIEGPKCLNDVRSMNGKSTCFDFLL